MILVCNPCNYLVSSNGIGLGGYCDFNKSKLMEEADHISPLQSWGPELQYFTQLRQRPIEEGDCDVVVDKPTFLMKIDACKLKFSF